MSSSPSPAFSWPQNCKGAVSLTYDDAVPCHHQSVAPFLQQHGIRGTFYVPIGGWLQDATEAWRQVAKDGHELGNHTLFHPCYAEEGNPLTWLDPGYNLRLYSPKRWQDEVRLANWALRQIDGKTRRTYGNTCHNRWVGEGEAKVCIDTLMAEHFVAARGAYSGRAINPAAADLTNLGTAGGDRKTFAVLREELERVREAGEWMIYTFHAVGSGEHSLFIEEDEHRKLVEWLTTESDLWVAPVVEIATWIQEKTQG